MNQQDINQLIAAMKKIFPTKEEAATKDDLKRFATKDDLKRFATKKDLLSLENRLNKKFATKDDLEELRESLEDKISHLPTKEEFYSRMDKLSGEFQKIYEEQVLQTGRLSEQSDILEDHQVRIQQLEVTISAPPS